MPAKTLVKKATAAKKAAKKSTAAAKGEKSKVAGPDVAPTGKKKSVPKKKTAPKAQSTKVQSKVQSREKPTKKAAKKSVAKRGVPREALVVLEPQPARGDHIDLGIVAGSDGPTGWLGAGATDLCEVGPSGLVAVAGDTFRGPKFNVGDWSPSLALHVNTLAGKISFDGSFGWCNLYLDGWGPGGYPPKGSQLPAGTVRVGGVDYLMVTRTSDLRPLDSRLVVMNPDHPEWVTAPGSEKPASYEDFNQTQISGCEAPDGFVYVVADSFSRDRPVRLYRCRPETFTNRDSWSRWGTVNGDPNRWDWDQPVATPVHPDNFGELSFRMIEGKFVLSAFNQTTGRIEIRVADRPEQILHPGCPPMVPPTPCTVVVDQQQLPNNYGGYIVPGSTLDRMRVLVSQWGQWGERNYPYNVREYVVNLIR